jgi:hypothetical protein
MTVEVTIRINGGIGETYKHTYRSREKFDINSVGIDLWSGVLNSINRFLKDLLTNFQNSCQNTQAQ